MSNTKKIKNNTRKSNKSGLNLNIINQANEKQFITKTIVIPVDDIDYEVIVDQVFKKTKIEKMVTKFLKSENVNKLDELDESTRIGYVMFLIVKEFTNLDIPINLKFEEEITLINSLIDLDIFEKIVNEFPDDEIKKVNEFMLKFSQNLNKILADDKLMNELGNMTDIDNVNETEIESGGQVG